MLLDYVLAYGAVGIAGVFKEKNWAIELSTLVACTTRFAIHFISGITLYAITVPTNIEGTSLIFANPFMYSLVYNLLYMLTNTVIAIVVMSLLRYPLKKMKKI